MSSSSETTVAIAALGLATAWLAWRAWRPRREEKYSPIVRGYVGTHRLRDPPPSPPVDASPLTPWLDRAVDKLEVEGLPKTDTASAAPPERVVAPEPAETRRVMDAVVRRIDARSPLGLALVSVDAPSVRKTVDDRGTARFEADVTVFSKTRAFASKVAVAAEVTRRGTVMVRRLRVHGAAVEGPGPRPAPAADPDLERYARFEPAVRPYS